MVMEVPGTDITPSQVKVVTDEESEVENTRRMNMNMTDSLEKTDLLDGSSVVNEEIKKIVHVPDSVVPKDAVDEWPAEKQVHTFYFIRYRSYEDPKLKAKIEQADKEVQRNTQGRIQITEALREKRSEKADLISQLKPLQEEERQFRALMDGKRKEMEPLQAALGKLRGTRNVAAEKGVGICSSEEELNETIQGLHYCIQHESNTLAVEKQLIKEIRQLEASREKVVANAALRAKIQESFGQKDAIQDQVKLIGVDLDGVRKEQQAIRAKIQNLEEKLNCVRVELDSLQNELVAVNENRDKAYQTLTLLRKERDDLNACFFQYRSLMNSVKGLSMNTDIEALEELSLNELEKFMSQWNSSKDIRNDYEKRMLSSLDIRQLSRDGRMRNPDEKPIISAGPLSSEAVKEPAKAISRKEKENVIPPLQEAPSSRKIQEAAAAKSTELESPKLLETEIVQEGPSKFKEVDPAKLKEMKREEEIGKAKLAIERKKKLAEKAAAKAAIRAQKDAEKKLKEKEKKVRKKAGSSLQPADTEQVEIYTNNAETELQDEINLNAEAPIPEKNKDHFKDKSIRSHGRVKGQSHMPKPLLKRKKQHSYWLWASPAVACTLLTAILGYYYFLGKSQ